jgi:hypothetical protein
MKKQTKEKKVLVPEGTYMMLGCVIANLKYQMASMLQGKDMPEFDWDLDFVKVEASLYKDPVDALRVLQVIKQLLHATYEESNDEYQNLIADGFIRSLTNGSAKKDKPTKV